MRRRTERNRQRDSLGQAAYEAHCTFMPRVIRSNPPPWTNLSPAVQKAWQQVGGAVQLRVLSPLLASPADMPEQPKAPTPAGS